MPKISILTPTCRPAGLRLVDESLQKQTLRGEFEWIIGSDFKPQGLVTPFLWVPDPPKPEGYYFVLNRLYNKMIRKAKGDLIVSIQDYTSFEPNGLEKFWYYFTNGYERVCVSGVGDKYDDKEMRHKVWSDPRIRNDFGTFYECFPRDVEANYAAYPKKGLYEVGGFDEELDRYAGMDHISVQERLDEIGYKFFLDQTNITRSFVHDRLPDWDKKHAMHGGYEKRKQELKEAGTWPKLPYLA